MRMRSELIRIRTGDLPRVVDISDQCKTFLIGARDGLLSIFVAHATAGLAVIETGAGSDDDLLATLERLLPPAERWRHGHGAHGHGRDHVVPALVSPSLVVPVVAGRMQLGTWQSICLVDTNVDNPDRTVRLSFVEG
jgi:secondary thiamine-phosphate synthase enzyme